MNTFDPVLCILFLSIAPLAAAGLALMNTGLTRSRNAAHAMMAALCATASAAGGYFLCGRSFQGAAGLAAWSLNAGGRAWDWAGALPFFFRGMHADGPPPELLAAWMGLVGAMFVSLIPVGSGTGRWRLGPLCVSSALLGGLIFPLFAHWTWSGGWLASLGYIDPGGSGVIHAVGGMTGLAIAWLLGPRRGKYAAEGMPMAMPGHDAVLVLFGCLLAGVGWLGVNGAGAVLFMGVGGGRIALIAINTMLSAAGAAGAAAILTRVRYGKPDASLTANGWTGGLVASSASSVFVPPAAALLIGLVAGTLVAFSVEILDVRLEVDDPGGSISVHGVAGLWGVIATGLFGPAGHLMAQVVGVSTLLGCVLPAAYGINWLLDRVIHQRAPADAEHQGLDLHELGAGAYPEFMTHSDDYMQR